MKKQNAKDRRDESRAMKSKDRGMDSQFFGMISEDSSCVANLPS